MRWKEIKPVLKRLSECDPEFGKFGLYVFFERGWRLFDSYRLLIRMDATNENNFECLLSAIHELGKKWKIVYKNDEIFLQVYSH